MKKTGILLLLLVGCLLTGCAGYGTITKNLSKDGAIVVMDINSPWGKQKVTRVGPTTNRVEVTEEGAIIINGK